MSGVVVILGLSLLAILGCLAGPGREGYDLKNRVHWFAVGISLLVASQIPNPWAAVLMAMCGIGLFNAHQPSRLLQYLWAMTAVGGAYALVSGVTERWMIPVALWVMVGITTLLGLWAAYSIRWLRDDVKYEHTWPLGPFTFRLYEPVRDLGVECGQGHPNHLQSLQMVGCGAAVGLIGLGYSWVQWLLPVILLPVLQIQYKANNPTQGLFHLVTLGVAWTVYQVGVPWGCYLAGAYGVGLLLLARPWNMRQEEWWDTGRMHVWRGMLRRWRAHRWPNWVFGVGTGSWVILHLEELKAQHEQGHGKSKDVILFTTAHNEFVQQLVEYGIVGTLALVGYVVSVGWALAHGGPEGVALLWPAVMLVSTALVSFPWTFYHEVMFGGRNQLNVHGAPALTTLSFVVAVLAEAVRG